MDQDISFCTTSDGVTIAYATLGEGPPLVYVTGWPGHLQLEFDTEHSGELIRALSEGVRLVRYDMRGSGLSDTDDCRSALGRVSSVLPARIRGVLGRGDDAAAAGTSGEPAIGSMGPSGRPRGCAPDVFHPETASGLDSGRGADGGTTKALSAASAAAGTRRDGSAGRAISSSSSVSHIV